MWYTLNSVNSGCTMQQSHVYAVGVALQQILIQLLCLVKIAQVVLRLCGSGADPVAVRELRRQVLQQKGHGVGPKSVSDPCTPWHAPQQQASC